MAPKKRSTTPGPKAAAAPSVRSAQASQASGRSARATDGENAPAGAAAGGDRRSLRRDKVAPRRHTDCGCLLVLVVFLGYLAALRLRGDRDGDLKRLTNGFDFRGRLCGSRGNDVFLHWCEHEGRTLWESPICVHRCPTGGEPVLCPVFAEEAAEAQEQLANGSVVLTKVTRHVLTPLSASRTHRRWRFCVPESLGSAGLESLVGGDSWQQYIFQEVGNFASLAGAPRLVATCAASAVLTALLWVLLLSKCTEALLRIQFLFTGIALAALGLVLSITAIASWGGDSALLASSMPSELQGAAEGVGRLVSAGIEGTQLEAVLRDHGGVIGPTAQVCIGAVLTLLGAGVLIFYAVWKELIAVAADCSREACKVAFRSPSLALLPLLEILLYALVFYETAYSLALVLSTADVKPREIEILSQRVAGIHRSLQWNAELAMQTLAWIFGFLWLSEIVTAFRSFVLSKVAVTWYFEPTSQKNRCRLPILDGTYTAAAYHLGSLALGAFVMACLRAVHWLFLAMHKLAGEKKDRSRCLMCCLGCFEFLVTLATQLARHLTASAYTELAISSTSLMSASYTAATLTLDGAGLQAVRSMFLRPIMLIGNLAYAVAFSWGVHVLLGLLGDGEALLDSGFLKALSAEKAALGSPVPIAVLTGVVAFVVVRAFTAVVEDVADAVLYCYLWDRSDGVVDADDVPASFKALLGKMAK